MGIKAMHAGSKYSGPRMFRCLGVQKRWSKQTSQVPKEKGGFSYRMLITNCSLKNIEETEKQKVNKA